MLLISIGKGVKVADECFLVGFFSFSFYLSGVCSIGRILTVSFRLINIMPLIPHKGKKKIKKAASYTDLCLHFSSHSIINGYWDADCLKY